METLKGRTALVTGASRGLGAAIALALSDGGQEADVDHMIQAVNETYQHIDIAVMNATGPQPFLTIEQQTWQRYLDQLEFFLKSPLLILQRVVAGMRSRGYGRIIQIGSEVFELGNPMFANYVAAKGAQLGQTRSWAKELAP